VTVTNAPTTRPVSSLANTSDRKAKPSRFPSFPLSPAFVVGGTIFWLTGCLLSRPLDPNSEGGFITRISPLWYLGLLLIVTSLGLARQVGSHARKVDTKWAGLAVFTMTAALAATPPIIYPGIRFSWALKHVGVTDYILTHHTVNPSIDIYQAWPGFFAAMATLCRIAGISDPLLIARWWPLIIDLVALAAMRQLSRRFLSDYRSWLACAIFELGNLIGQDYYSPQSLGFALTIIVFALAVELPGRRTQGHVRLRIITITVVSLAIAVTHQLSPYMLSLALIVLAVFGLVRYKWIPLLPLIPAILWALSQYRQVRIYFHLNELGNVASNVRLHQAGTPVIHYVAIGQAYLALWIGTTAIIAFTALFAWWQARNRVSYALLLCAASAGSLVLANQYGGEGLFRVVLFALPWLSIAAAQLRQPRNLPIGRVLWVGLPILLAANVLGTTVLDWVNIVRPGELEAERYFETHAPRGSVIAYLGSGYAPEKSTANYPAFTYVSYPYVSADGTTGAGVSSSTLVIFMTDWYISTYNRPTSDYYMMIGQGLEASGQYSQLYTSAQYNDFVSAIGKSPYWSVVYQHSGTALFRLRSKPSTQS
jgi:hypothetical protein